jgi:hypothetical protein
VCDSDEALHGGLFLCLESKVPILGERGHDETRIATGEMTVDRAGWSEFCAC